MAKKKNQKIIRYRKPLNLNVGMIIFALIFAYLVFNVYTYMGKEKIQFFEVVEGGIVNDKTYTGIVLRQESTKYLESSGYVNYYVGEKSVRLLEQLFIRWMKQVQWQISLKIIQI